MQVMLLSREKLVENAISVNANLAKVILDTMVPWHREVALALLLQDALGRAPVNKTDIPCRACEVGTVIIDNVLLSQDGEEQWPHS